MEELETRSCVQDKFASLPKLTMSASYKGSLTATCVHLRLPCRQLKTPGRRMRLWSARRTTRSRQKRKGMSLLVSDRSFVSSHHIRATFFSLCLGTWYGLYKHVNIIVIKPASVRSALDVPRGAAPVDYFRRDRRPRVLLTTNYKPTAVMYAFIADLLEVLPDATYYKRQVFLASAWCLNTRRE